MQKGWIPFRTCFQKCRFDVIFFNPKQGVDADIEKSTNFLLLIQYDYHQKTAPENAVKLLYSIYDGRTTCNWLLHHFENKKK